MIRRKYHIDEWDWSVYVYYAVDAYYTYEIIARLVSIGCKDDDIHNAYESLTSGNLNTGLTFSNMRKRESVMVIALTSSNKEFEMSWRHECGHLAKHIAQADGIDPFGEEIQYLGDAIVGAMWNDARLLLCDCHRKELYRELHGN